LLTVLNSRRAPRAAAGKTPARHANGRSRLSHS
jgi:hypothetical protein